jgi:hypothetical protein
VSFVHRFLIIYLLIAASGIPLPLVHAHDMMSESSTEHALLHHENTFHRSASPAEHDELHFHWIFAFGSLDQTEQGLHTGQTIGISGTTFHGTFCDLISVLEIFNCPIETVEMTSLQPHLNYAEATSRSFMSTFPDNPGILSLLSVCLC